MDIIYYLISSSSCPIWIISIAYRKVANNVMYDTKFQKYNLPQFTANENAMALSSMISCFHELTPPLNLDNSPSGNNQTGLNRHLYSSLWFNFGSDCRFDANRTKTIWWSSLNLSAKIGKYSLYCGSSITQILSEKWITEILRAVFSQ